MNLRDYKKEVEYKIGGFVDDCTQYISRNPNSETGKVTALINEAVDVFYIFRDKANTVGGCASKKTYFRDACKELDEAIDSLSRKLSDIITARPEAGIPAAESTKE